MFKPAPQEEPMRTTPLTLALTVAAGASSMLLQADPISAKALKKAITAYCPVLILHKDEQYKPTSVEAFLQVAKDSSYFDKDAGKTRPGLELRDHDRDDYRKGNTQAAKVYVNVKEGPDSTDIQYWFFYAFNGPGTAEVDLGFGAETFVTGDAGIHEADWEHVTVRVDNETGEAIPEGALYRSVHSEGNWGDLPLKKDYFGKNVKDVLLADMSMIGKPRLVIYASKNGHAAFLTPGKDYNEKRPIIGGMGYFGLLNDCSEPGEMVDFLKAAKDYRNQFILDSKKARQVSWEIIGLHKPDGTDHTELAKDLGWKKQDWQTKYPGRWGRVLEKPVPLSDIPIIGKYLKDYVAKGLKAVGALEELTYEAGPRAPWDKGATFTTYNNE
jgi:hypothetical protein